MHVVKSREKEDNLCWFPVPTSITTCTAVGFYALVPQNDGGEQMLPLHVHNIQLS